MDAGYPTVELRGKRLVFLPSSRLQEMVPNAFSLVRLRGFAVGMSAPASSLPGLPEPLGG